MSEDLNTKKENLKKNIENSIELIDEKFDSSQSIKIYDNLSKTIKEEFEKLSQPTNNCKSCGEALDPWEKEICGPCKIADERYSEEED